MHHQTKNSEKLKKLREEPRLSKDIQLPTGGQLRDLISKLQVTNKRGDWKLIGGKTDSIYHLIGDERRAARLFVKENPDFSRECFESETRTPLHQLNDFMRKLILQEYEIMEYNGEI